MILYPPSFRDISSTLTLITTTGLMPGAGNFIESKLQSNAGQLAGKTLQAATSAIAINHFFYEKIHHKLFWHGLTDVKFSIVDRSKKALAWWKSVGTPGERAAHAAYWAPRITLAICAITLLLPLIFFCLKKIAESCKAITAIKIIATIDFIVMTSIKITNIAMCIFGIYLGISFSMPFLTILYSASLLLQTAPYIIKLMKSNH